MMRTVVEKMKLVNTQTYDLLPFAAFQQFLNAVNACVKKIKKYLHAYELIEIVVRKLLAENYNAK